MSAGQIWVLPWADTRPIAGEMANQWTVDSTTYTGTWVPGIFTSWLLAGISGISGTIPIYNYERYAATAWEGVVQIPSSTVSKCFLSNSYLIDQGLHNVPATYQGSSVTVTAWECLAPKRPMATDPICVDICDGGVVATLTGVTYRNTYGGRRHWVLEMLLDGPLDAVAAPNTYPDARRYWRQFLRRAELGVTVVLDTTNALSWSQGPNSFLIPYGKPYCGCPNPISGVITDCTQTRWQGTAGDKLARLKVTMTIAEVTPPGVL